MLAERARRRLGLAAVPERVVDLDGREARRAGRLRGREQVAQALYGDDSRGAELNFARAARSELSLRGGPGNAPPLGRLCC